MLSSASFDWSSELSPKHCSCQMETEKNMIAVRWRVMACTISTESNRLAFRVSP